MRVASFVGDGSEGWGTVEDDYILDIGRALDIPELKLALEEGDLAELVKRARPQANRIPLTGITWLPVVPKPNKIFCVGLNYVSHREETGRQATDYPVIFTRFGDSQIGHLEAMVRPRVSTSLDYEGELAVIIGRHGRYVPRSQASDYIAGYACYNDGTLRDWQRHTHQFTPGKNFPGTGGFGPWMVTPDEAGDLSRLRLTTSVNGVVVQDATLDLLIFGIDELIEYCSSFSPLAPGDVIVTGTPGGVGFKRTPPVFLVAGDVVDVEITAIGKLSNMVVDEAT